MKNSEGFSSFAEEMEDGVDGFGKEDYLGPETIGKGSKKEISEEEDGDWKEDEDLNEEDDFEEGNDDEEEW